MNDEDKQIWLDDTVNDFWLAFSELCNSYIETVRIVCPDLVEEAVGRMGEHTSIYGRKIN